MSTHRSSTSTTRRRFITGATCGGALLATVPLHNIVLAQSRHFQDAPPERTGLSADTRANEAFRKRHDAASAYLQEGRQSKPLTNGDEERYADRRASFCKTLPQNDYAEVHGHVFDRFCCALAAGSVGVLEELARSPVADRTLANPMAAHAFEMVGPDSWSLRMPPAPAFAGAEQAAEMGEVYWQALTRDVPFRNYAESKLINDAVTDLNRFTHRLGAHPTITVGTVFRGETLGDRIGPYISQFLWMPTRWGLAELSQQFLLPLPGQAFCLAQGDLVALQRGAAPFEVTQMESVPRHIATGRDLAEYVHSDVAYQAYLTAALIMLGLGREALDPGNPYQDAEHQNGFVTLGAVEIVDLVAKAASAALKAAWFQKWLVHRRLRPEVFAARAHFKATGERDYDVHQELLDSGAAAQLQSLNGSLLLPLAYPEGSPTHPSYPAGHAVVAGACATMLKALFNESYELPDPVEASADGFVLHPWKGRPLKLGGEINKLANNIALGRDVAGVHYRSDGIAGLALGEQVAIGILTDYAATRCESFDGYQLTRFDGTRVSVGGQRSEITAGAPTFGPAWR